MRYGIVCLWMMALLGPTPAVAQTTLTQSTGERLPTPRAVELWQPSSTQLPTTPLEPTGPRVTEVTPQPSPTATQATKWTFGNTTVYPAITGGALHDDNVFATKTNRQSDWAAIVRPELGVRWTGPQYDFFAHGYGEERKYSRFASENQFNGSASIGGTVQPNSDTQYQGRARYLHAHEDRGVSESEIFSRFDKPVGYDLYEVAGAVNRRADRVWSSTGAAASFIDFSNPTIGGFPISQSYRNGNIEVATARVGYVVAPNTSVFGEVSPNRRDFEVNNFDSWGYRAVTGVLLEPGQSGVIKGEAFAGYMYQDYSGVTFQSISTWTYGVGIAWQLAPSLTAIFEGRREAKESGLLPISAPLFCVTAVTVTCGVSLIESLVGGRLDYAITQNVVIGGGATYLVDEFLGGARTDHTLSPLASLKLLLSPALTLSADYRYLRFNSSGVGVPSYFRSVAYFSLNGRF
jgi:hypothetical protein